MAAIVVEVPCEGYTHRIELRGDGTAEMLDHDELVVRAFVAFNAEPPECLAALDDARKNPVRFVFNHVKMDDKVKGRLACDFAQRVLPLFEASYPDDARPRKAIETARAYWRGKATIEQVAAAARAADAAAYAAADAAAAAAAVAAWAARDAALAAGAAAWAAWAAEYAAWAVYHNAKAQSLDDKAAEAAEAAEKRWQLGRTAKVLDALQRGKRWPRLS